MNNYDMNGMQNQNYNQQPMMNNQPMNNSSQSGNKINKILIITNVITFILLIVFVVAFFMKGSTTEQIEKVEEENNNYNSTATTDPVSNDWTKYQFGINGKTLSLSCSYKEFKEISGFTMKSSDEKSYLDPNYSMSVNLYINDSDNQKLALYTEIQNNTSNEVQYNETVLTEIWQSSYQVNTNKASAITFPGGLKAGMEITKDDIVELFGEPNKIETSGDESYNYITLLYTENKSEYSSSNYYKIRLLNGKIDELTLNNSKN